MNTRRTINSAEIGFFDYQDWVDIMSKLPTHLDSLKELIDFELFRELLENDLPKVDYKKGGRPAYDSVFMFKVLILQRSYGQMSDDSTEFAIKDRLSFQRFLDISLADKMPDANTIRNYREVWSSKGTIEKSFDKFNEILLDAGIKEKEGKMVDASFVEAPRQQNTRAENKHIKETGEVPEEWDKNKVSQKDVDARWAKKNNETFYGYKVHAVVDTLTKLITNYSVTGAEVHDSQVFTELLSESDMKVYADSAYRSKEILEELKEKKIEPFIIEKAKKNNPLTEEQKKSNKSISKIRSRVEHVFGFMTNSMKAMYIRSIGKIRAKGIIGLNNLIYNMRRYEQIIRLKLIELN